LKRKAASAEAAESSYRLRTAIASLKVDVDRLDDLVKKEDKRKGKKRMDEEELKTRRELVQLCNQHVTEVEELETRRFLDKIGAERSELMKQSDGESEGKPRTRISTSERRAYGQEGEMEEKDSSRKALFGGRNRTKSTWLMPNRILEGAKVETDPFKSDLPDIDLEQDFQEMNLNNKVIENDLSDIGKGVRQLRGLANDMGKELDGQNDQIRDLEKGLGKVMDNVETINIKMKHTVDAVMAGPKFMVNCILLCVILALVVFIVAMFK
jgi:t-SNARE complex subunit (syntaxin)